jgi:hypothetical protein
MPVSDTTFGFDIASHQAGMDVRKVAKEGFDFLCIKLTEGNSYTNPYYLTWRAQAEEAQLLVADYHALHAGNAEAQADYHCAKKVDKSIPTMLDFEPFGDNPTRDDAKAFIARCKTHGVTVTLNYHPRWYWQSIGSPLLVRLPKTISSAYPHNTPSFASAGYAAAGGAKGIGWQRYGGRKPVIWQFMSVGRVSSWSGNVDFNAYKGTRDELAATGLFKDYAPKPKPTPKPTKGPAGSNVKAAEDALVKAQKQHKRSGPVRRAIDAALKLLRGSHK